MKVDLRSGGQILGLKSRFEVWRPDLRSGELMRGLEGLRLIGQI